MNYFSDSKLNPKSTYGQSSSIYNSRRLYNKSTILIKNQADALATYRLLKLSFPP